MKPQGMEKQRRSDSKGTRVGEAEDQGAGAHGDMLDPTARPVCPSFTIQFGLPMLRVRSMRETHWEQR